LSMDDFKEASTLFEDDIYEVLEPKTAVARRNSAGGTGFAQIKVAIDKGKKCL
jgi:argininosuccinate lyase